DWGHDFRPDYRRIVRVLNALPSNIPVLATTATANDRVVRDVSKQLGDLQIVRGPLIRTSLKLQNIWLPSPAARMGWLAEKLPSLPGSGIIYTLTIRDAERVAEWLKRNGIDAAAYHSGSEDRVELEERLLRNNIKALVATVALGMGFDKPDLGFVIHFQRPGSIVHYYQQVGRAGRALDEAYGVLLSGSEDQEITDFFIRTAFPPLAHVEVVLAALTQAENGLSVPMMQQQINLTQSEIKKTLKFLSVETPSPVLKQGPRWYATPIEYRLDTDKIESLCRLRQAEQQEMLEYMRTKECLMRFISQALNDPYAEKCGRCANCLDEPFLSENVSRDLVNEAALFLRRNHQSFQPRKKWPKDALTAYGFNGNIPVDFRAEEGRALCLWGDAGWGQLVRDGKYKLGRFPDELIDGCVRMIDEWGPVPMPTWLTCVPSLTKPDLVPDFAVRLASRLGIPFVDCVKKTKQNRPQKEMQNSFQQARNLDGVFEVDDTKIPVGPVLLLDDMVDSRWTFTVIAALLRQAGCPAVFPLALALNSIRGG
ncbi:MAG: ATP-dependent DNA helicase RecG, partial [Armatimonadetes bacterium]|nr:ATP-dependent DNA helicase RecG [Armatimonadota bacterium]